MRHTTEAGESETMPVIREDSTQTDATGRFVFEDLNAGVTDLRIEARSWPSAWLSLCERNLLRATLPFL